MSLPQSARGLAQSKTLRVFQKSSFRAQRLGVRWPSTAFPGVTANGCFAKFAAGRGLPSLPNLFHMNLRQVVLAELEQVGVAVKFQVGPELRRIERAAFAVEFLDG